MNITKINSIDSPVVGLFLGDYFDGNDLDSVTSNLEYYGNSKLNMKIFNRQCVSFVFLTCVSKDCLFNSWFFSFTFFLVWNRLLHFWIIKNSVNAGVSKIDASSKWPTGRTDRLGGGESWLLPELSNFTQHSELADVMRL